MLLVIDVPTRRIEIAGFSSAPCGSWTEHVFRSLVDDFDGSSNGMKYLIHDRDPLFTAALVSLLKSAGINPIRLPPGGPNLNVYAEQFVRWIKEECLDQMIIFREQWLEIVVDEYVEHHHHERPHQGIGNVLIEPAESSACVDDPCTRRDRVGGLLTFYHPDCNMNRVFAPYGVDTLLNYSHTPTGTRTDTSALGFSGSPSQVYHPASSRQERYFVTTVQIQTYSKAPLLLTRFLNR